MALLAADAVGYSRLMAADARATMAALDAARATFRRHVEQHAGRVVDTAGDSVLAVFSSAASALDAAMAIQRQLHAGEHGMPFRIGIHLGDVIEKADGSVYGNGVNIAARLQALAVPGGISVSDAVRGALGEPGGMGLLDQGLHRIKNFDEALHAWRVPLGDASASEGAVAAPQAEPARAAAFVPQLPMSIELIGRDSDIATLLRMLERHRLVTIVGAGGIGKTSLAAHVARDWGTAQALPLAWVDLAPIGDPALLPVTVAQALGLSLGSGAHPLHALLARLAAMRAAVVLDNAEHLVDAVAALAKAMLGAAAGLHLLVTSQAALNIDGERVFRLGPLEIPDESAPPAAAVRAGAVALFVDSVRAADHRFEPSDDELRTVVRLCRRLDGLPLAIRLAAARAPLLGIGGMASLLDEHLTALGGDRRDLPVRQQTLLAALAWSHGLLTPHDRAVFRRLGVFVGGFTMDLAVAVCGDEDSDRWKIVDALGHLVDRSLVVADGGDPPRYRLLESARAYARSQLEQAGEAELAPRRHAQAMASALRAAFDALWAMPEDAWSARWGPELDNTRAALSWSERQDPLLWMELVGGAPALFRLLGLAYELRHRAGAVDADAVPGVDAEVAARYWMARATMQGGEALGPYRDYAIKAATFARTLDDKRWLYAALCQQAASSLVSPEEAPALLAEIAALEHADWPARLRAQRWLAEFAMHNVHGSHADALAAAETGLELAGEAGSLQLATAFANWVLVALLSLQRTDEALRRSREMLTWVRASHDAMSIAFQGTCATCALAARDFGTARRQFATMFDLCRTVEWNSFDFFAGRYVTLALAEGRIEAAAQLLGYAGAVRDRAWGTPRFTHHHEEARARLAAALDAATLERLLAQGQTMGREAVCALVLAMEQDVGR